MNRRDKAKKVDYIADQLVQELEAPGSRDFFCKCAWKLSENDIWTALEKAQKPNVDDHLKYFIFLCMLKME